MTTPTGGYGDDYGEDYGYESITSLPNALPFDYYINLMTSQYQTSGGNQ